MHVNVPQAEIVNIARAAERLLFKVKAVARTPAQRSDCSPSTTPVARVQVATDVVLVRSAQDALTAYRSLPMFNSPDLFVGRPWLLMLELFIVARTGGTLPVTNACLTLGGSQSSAIRTVGAMEKRGLIESSIDPRDGRRRLLRLSGHSDSIISDYLCKHHSASTQVSEYNAVQVARRA